MRFQNPTHSKFILTVLSSSPLQKPRLREADLLSNQRARAKGCFSQAGRDLDPGLLLSRSFSFGSLRTLVSKLLDSQGFPLGLGAGFPFSASPSPWNFPLQLPPLPDTPPWAKFPAPSASPSLITPRSHPPALRPSPQSNPQSTLTPVVPVREMGGQTLIEG